MTADLTLTDQRLADAIADGEAILAAGQDWLLDSALAVVALKELQAARRRLGELSAALVFDIEPSSSGGVRFVLPEPNWEAARRALQGRP